MTDLLVEIRLMMAVCNTSTFCLFILRAGSSKVHLTKHV
jgi:hypothetical protein